MTSRGIRRLVILLIYVGIIAPLLLWLWWPAAQSKHRVVVSLDASGQVRINGELTSREQFRQRLDQALKARPGPVELQADASASTVALVPVMESLREAGVQDVQFSAR